MPKRGRPTTRYTALDDDMCLQRVMQAYEEEGRVGQTVRHFYYKLISSDALTVLTSDGGEAAYGFVVRLLVKARQTGLLPYSAIVDPGRRSFDFYGARARNADEYVKRAFSVGTYILDIWRGQPSKLELWCEKDGQAEFLRQLADKYRVPVYITKGYSSFTVLTDAARRFSRDSKQRVILYCGDYDPTGLDIERNVLERLQQLGATPFVERVALTQADLPTLSPHAAVAIKKGDTRSKKFIEKYGEHQKGYELEAMPASIMLTKLKAAIEDHMDMDELKRALGYEKQITEFARQAIDMLEAQHRFTQQLDGNMTPEMQKYLT